MPPHMLITAGPTWEPIDAVRYLANRSSGWLGICIAEAARAAGWEVTLLLGAGATCGTVASGTAAVGAERGTAAPGGERGTVAPGGERGTAAPGGEPSGGTGFTTAEGGASTPIRTLRFESTADLERLLAEHFPACDALVMAAAVSDYRPRAPSPGKWLRGAARLVLELEPTPDLVAACAAHRRPGQLILGFALEEPAVLETRAREKLAQKGLDAIVANPLETMGAERIRATLYTARAETIRPPAAELSKPQFAQWLVEWLRDRHSPRS